MQELSHTLLKGISGAVVVLDCKSGGVNCMVSTPSFDNDEFSNGISNEKWNQLVTDESNPLLNRSISGLYSPGSTYKLITALFAIEKSASFSSTLQSLIILCANTKEDGSLK